MNLPVISALILSAAGAGADLKTGKIPNILHPVGGIFGLCMWIGFRGLRGILVWLAGAVVLFSVSLLFYFLGAIGAGDVKLLGTLGGILSFKRGVWVLFMAGVINAGIGLIVLIGKKEARQIPGRMASYVRALFWEHTIPEDGEYTKIPFAVGIFGAVLLRALWEGRWYL